MSPPAEDNRKAALILLIGALVFLAATVDGARRLTPTIDEYAHVPAGVAYVSHDRLDLYGKNPPLLKQLMALALLDDEVIAPAPPRESHGWAPWIYGAAFEQANADRYFELFFRARLVSILLGLLGGLSLWWWARQRTTEVTASAVAALWLLNPTVIAHSSLATLDVGASVFILWSVLSLLGWVERGGAGRAALFGAIWGAALLVKFTAVLLLPALLFALFLRSGRERLIGLPIMFATSTFVLNAGYRFEGAFPRLNDLPIQSSLMHSAKALLGGLPLPTPRLFILGFDAQRLDTEQGEFGAFFMGVVSESGSLFYDPIVFLLKTPLPLLVAMALVLWGAKRFPLEKTAGLVLGASAASFGFFLLLFNSLDLGVRYLLPLLPLLSLLCLGTIRVAVQSLRILVPAVMAAMILSIAWIHPGEIGWFNLLAMGQGDRICADSNVDWGQDLYRLPAALEEMAARGPVHLLYFGHVAPGRYGLSFKRVPDHPVKGIVVVSHQFRVGLSYLAPWPDGGMSPVRPGHLDWLKGHEPTMRLGSLWVFDLRGEPEAGTGSGVGSSRPLTGRVPEAKPRSREGLSV